MLNTKGGEMERLRKYQTTIGIRVSSLQKKQIGEIARGFNLHPSELVRLCINCFLKEESCLVKQSLTKGEIR